MGTGRQRRGFTLVEILVTVAILTILGAILFNVFARVRENGRIQVCQNNLKQLVLAVQQYAHDNDGRMPGTFWQPQLDPYIKATSLIWCPTNKALLQGMGFKERFLRKHFYVMGYWYNGLQLQDLKMLIKDGVLVIGLHESAISDPAKTWVHGDDAPHPDDVLTGHGGTLGVSPCDDLIPLHTLHNGGANYSFLDGHIKWLTPEGRKSIECGAGNKSAE